MTVFQLFFITGLTAFFLAFPIPFFARRFGKFLPADAGTALVRSFHIPRFAKTDDPKRRKQRRTLWIKLIRAGFLWGLSGIAAVFLLIYFEYPAAYFIMLWLCGLLACVDEKLHLLPDVLTIPLLIFGFYFSASSLTAISAPDSAAGALFGFLLPTLTAALMTPFYPRSLGGGDFKMMSAVGAWLGFMGLAVTILASVLFFCLIAAVRREKQGPYGTSLLLGVIAVLIMQKIPALEFLFVIL